MPVLSPRLIVIITMMMMMMMMMMMVVVMVVVVVMMMMMMMSVWSKISYPDLLNLRREQLVKSLLMA